MRLVFNCSAVMLLVWAMCTPSARAQQPSPTIDAREVEAFMDGVMGTVMRQRQIPGAVLVIVQNGDVLMNKGYGYANRDTKAPVLPDRTLFRIASVSKTVNATALMQLVERGEIGLETPANEVLQKYGVPISLPEMYGQPIRVIDLVNHTAGFDERAIAMTRLNKADVPALSAYLVKRMPPQVMPARETVSYSNHGVALSGYFVELIANQPYNSYVRDHIFSPLGMNQSSFEWTDALAPDVAQGYEVVGGVVKPVPFDHGCIGPAGTMLSCGTDMARYMIAHLQKGRYGGSRIYSEATAEILQRVHFKQDERLLGGMAVGFFTGTRNGHRYLEHGGDFYGFASQIWLLPDQGVGVFTSCTVDDGQLRGVVQQQFMDRYFPASQPIDETAALPLGEDAGKYTGVYRNNRYARRTIEKLATLLEQTQVSRAGENALVLSGGESAARRFIQTKDGVFTDLRTGTTMVFRTSKDGNVTHMLFDGSAFERVAWYEKSKWQILYVATLLLILLSALVGWPILRIRRKFSATQTPHAPAHYRFTAWVYVAFSVLLLLAFGWTM
ncbi:MAG TPA: serine hydrolase domain-containing protein, partial [Candidatus Hydrogenedentes bacterium]|nr:serine hydrolase domain-containing protein [Candidatus Hydrogenedentota bacterium]